VKDPALLLTAILADATNLGLGKMAESCPGTSPAKLSWLVAWHIRDETYSKALAEIVNHQHSIPFAMHWGEGTTSSSDGQRYRAGGRGEAAGQVNAKYGNDPGVTFYTHVSDQYAPFHTKVINATVRMRRMCSMACSITSPSCGLRSTTPIPPASPITSSLCVTCSASASRLAFCAS